jgi:lysylphosphatidylglycerol synthetase-like protein (DUF2156 family)
MTEEMKMASRICAAIGATVAVFATFLPWYSFAVVLPAPGTIGVFDVTSTLWGVTTLAPILIAVGAVGALTLVALADASRPAGVVTLVIALAILVYGIVRCFVIPDLGVAAVTARGAVAARAATSLEGGPFVEIGGGLLLAIGAIGMLWPSALRYGRGERAREWGGPTTAAPAR